MDIRFSMILSAWLLCFGSAASESIGGTIVAALAQTAATDRSHQYIGPAVLCTAGSFSKLVNVVRVTRLACVDPTRAEVDRRLFE